MSVLVWPSRRGVSSSMGPRLHEQWGFHELSEPTQNTATGCTGDEDEHDAHGSDKEAPEGSGNVHEDFGAEVDNSREEEADMFDTEGSKDEAEDDDPAVNLRNPDGEFLPPAERRAAGSSVNKPAPEALSV
ncbi:MAG: hypothetical protein Q9203_002399 [Teloschistes exilis]